MPSSYLSSNTGTATNAKKFTLSMWIKRSNISGSDPHRFYQGYKDSSNRFYVMFDGTSSTPDTLWIYAVTGGTIQVYWTSSRRFRDLNGWYHFVFQGDSTLGTAADRLKVYVNNVLETSFTKNNNPGSNIDWGNQLAQTNGDLTISGTESQTQHFDGYMSHVAFVDGSVVAPTSFGETDSTSGIWKFKSPSGITWGNNGYHLKFENSGALGTDSSGNSNNFTVNGSLKQSLNTPSNSYATMNPLDNYYQSSTFTHGATTLEHGQSAWTYNTSTLKIPEATKFYCEGKVITMNQNVCGIAPEVTTGNGNSNTSLSWGGVSFRGNQGDVQKGGSTPSGTFATYTTNDIIQIACDTVNNKIYFGKNGTWLNSGDPTSGASGTGAVSIDDNKDYFFAFGDNTSGARGKWSINFGDGFFGTTAITSAGSNGNGSLFEYDCPTGYYALNTKNINTYG